MPLMIYYAAALTGRITGLARPSVRPSVCRGPSVKTKKAYRPRPYNS